MAMNDIATRHAALSGRFAELIDNVSDWDARTPVKEWTARDIVSHLITWLPGMLGSYGVELPTVEVGDDLADAWAEHSANVQTLVDDEDRLARDVETHMGPQPLGQVLDSFYLSDIFMHQWDLAKASGQDPDLDPGTLRAMVEGMTPQAEMLAGSGQFGTPVVLDESHTDEERLISLIGRDPQWQPNG